MIAKVSGGEGPPASHEEQKRTFSGLDYPRAVDARYVLGTWPLAGGFVNHRRQMGWGAVPTAQAIKTIQSAFERGIVWFDTADVYGHGRSNALIGEALSGVPRWRYAIALKVGYAALEDRRGLESAVVRNQFYRSLDQLSTDYVDLFSFHHLHFGPNNRDLEPALALLDDLKREGLIKATGYRFAHRYTAGPSEGESTLEGAAAAALRAATDTSVHAKVNLLCDQNHVDRVLREAADRVLFVNKPFAQGILWWLLTRDAPSFPLDDHRHYRRDFAYGSLRRLAAHMERILADEHIRSEDLPAAALAFLQRLPGRKAIIFGARTPQQVDDFVDLDARARLSFDADRNPRRLHLRISRQ